MKSDRAPLSAKLVYPIALLLPICLLPTIYWYILDIYRCSQALYDAWHRLQRIRGHGRAIDDKLEQIDNDSAADLRRSEPLLAGYATEITDAQKAFDKAETSVVHARKALETAKNEVDACEASLTKAKTELGFRDVKLQEEETIKQEMQKRLTDLKVIVFKYAIPVMAAVAVRKKVIGIGYFSSSF